MNFWETHYRVEEDGSIFRLAGTGCLKERKLKQCKNTGGYFTVQIYIDGKRRTMTVHRLLALTFIPNPNNLDNVDHIDRNRCNNHLSNLRWVTHQGNMDNMKLGKSGLRNIFIYKDGNYEIRIQRNKRSYSKCLPATCSIEEVQQERSNMLLNINLISSKPNNYYISLNV